MVKRLRLLIQRTSFKFGGICISIWVIRCLSMQKSLKGILKLMSPACWRVRVIQSLKLLVTSWWVKQCRWYLFITATAVGRIVISTNSQNPARNSKYPSQLRDYMDKILKIVSILLVPVAILLPYVRGFSLGLMLRLSWSSGALVGMRFQRVDSPGQCIPSSSRHEAG